MIRWTLEELGPASQAALGRRSGIHLSDMVAAINELADRGLVERAPDPADRRRNIISLTAGTRPRFLERPAAVNGKTRGRRSSQEWDTLDAGSG
jgi:DNA-binding MarR family transcriptional regulator